MNCKERLTIEYDGDFTPKELCTINRNGEADDCACCDEVCNNIYDDCEGCPIQKCFDRLGQLEDKLENGTLIELPCKVGDTVYEVGTDLKIHQSKIKNIIYDTNGIAFDERAIHETVFLTKEEAEARLKELQDG